MIFPIGFPGPQSLIPLIVFSFVLLIVVSKLYFKLQREKLWHETARAAIEKGQPVPLQALPNHGKGVGAWRDLRSGLMLVALGVAFFVSGGMHGGGVYQFRLPAYLLMGIGIAMLVSAAIQAAVASRRKDDREPNAGP